MKKMKKKQSDIITKKNNLALHKERKIRSMTVAKLDMYLKRKISFAIRMYKPKEKVTLVKAGLATVVAGNICHHLATQINMDAARASESSYNESEENIVALNK